MFELMSAGVALKYVVVGDVQVVFACDRSDVEFFEITFDGFWVQKRGRRS